LIAAASRSTSVKTRKNSSPSATLVRCNTALACSSFSVKVFTTLVPVIDKETGGLVVAFSWFANDDAAELTRGVSAAGLRGVSVRSNDENEIFCPVRNFL
jgi:hypothetical protein